MSLYVIFTTDCRLYQHSILLLFTTHSPISKHATHTQLPLPHISRLWLVLWALKKGHVRNFGLLSFFFLTFSMILLCAMLLFFLTHHSPESFMTFLSLLLLMDSCILLKMLEMHFLSSLKMNALSHHEIFSLRYILC